jgi:hypothetical protein
MAKIISGGGITGNKVKSVGVKTGPASTNKISPRGVSQYGYATGSTLKREGSYTSTNSALPVSAGRASQVPSGNAVAASTICGPGGSRTVYRSGTNAVHGAVVQGHSPTPRDTLSEYGREANPMSTVRRR